MIKVGSRVYVYPEVAYGIVRQISFRGYWVEFSSADADGSTGAWFKRDEVKSAGFARKATRR